MTQLFSVFFPFPVTRHEIKPASLNAKGINFLFFDRCCIIKRLANSSSGTIKHTGKIYDTIIIILLVNCSHERPV
jgi:hypothetical protein